MRNFDGKNGSLRMMKFLLKVYSPQFRRRFGDDLLGTIKSRLEVAAHKGKVVYVAVWVKMVLSMFGEGLRDRVSGLSRGRSSPRNSRIGASSDIGMDLWWALRSVVRAPGYSILIVGLLAVTIGANTAVFSVVNSILFDSLPYENSEDIQLLCETDPEGGGFCSNSFVNVADWNRRASNYVAIAAARGWSHNMSNGGRSEAVSVGLADQEIFNVFAFQPTIGRLFQRSDRAQAVTVLTHDAWRSRFGEDPSAIGSTISLDDESYEIIGVLPPGAEVPGMRGVAMWLPIRFDSADPENRNWRGFRAFGRLKSGVAPDPARQELTAIARALASEYPETNLGWGVSTRPLKDWVVGDSRTTLLAFLGAVALVLLVGCANITHLILTRTTRRSREIAIRSAIGAAPFRVSRMLLFENLWLGMGGALFGWFVASAGVSVFVALAPAAIPRLHEVSMDWRAALFLTIVTAISSIAVGLIPAVKGVRTNVEAALRTEGRGSTGSNRAAQSGLIVAEVALSLVLLLGAGLLMKTFTKFNQWSPGFETSGLLTTWVLASDAKYESGFDVSRLFLAATERIEAVPGVVSAGTASAGPLFGGGDGTVSAAPAGSLDDGGSEGVQLNWFDVGPGYLETLGVSLVAGRVFSEGDNRLAEPVAVLNRSAAARLFGSEAAVGKRVRMSERGSEVEVVGVVDDVTPLTPGEATAPEIYWPNLQRPRYASFLLIRVGGDQPTLVVPAIEAALADLDPDLSVATFATMEDRLGVRLVRPKFNALLISVFGLVAGALACVGIAGVVSFSVTGRMRELGVRKMLGATETSVLKMVMGETLRPIVAGLVGGLVGAVILSRFLTSMIFDLSPTDPATYSITVAAFTLVATVACWVPARMASRADPMIALRGD